MKRILLAALIMIAGVLTVSAVRYRGFAEVNYGICAPSKYYGSGLELGFATSHGVELDSGIFVGLGFDWLLGEYGEPNSSHNGGVVYENMFVEGRYSFSPLKKFSPYVGLRFGAGLGGYEDYQFTLAPYVSPAVGCSFNFARKCGMDVGIGYVFNGTKNEAVKMDEFFNSTRYIKVATSFIQLRIGLHF